MTQRNMKKKENVFEMSCGSDTRQIACVEEFLKKINSKLHIKEDILYRLMVSCTEAVNNAIIHGNKSDDQKRVLIQCIAKKDTLTIRVKDQGKGFDPNKLRNPTLSENLLKENGRGVFLMQSLMDKVSFKRLKSGSVVEMKVKIR